MSKAYIIRLVFIILFMLLFYFNYITLHRICTYAGILSCVLLFRVAYKLVESIKIKSDNFLFVLLVIDLIKISYIRLFFRLHLIMYYIKSLNIKYVTNIIVLVLRHVIVIPLLVVVYKVINILYLFKTKTFVDLLFNRVFGSVLAVLVFTPLLNILLHLYIFLLFISMMYYMLEKFANNPRLKFKRRFLHSLFNVDLNSAVNHRNNVSILVLLIKNGRVKNRGSKLY